MARKSKKTHDASSLNKQEMQNAAKTLFANIRFMSPDDPIKSIVITSSVPDEGKTTVSTNLAQAIATSGKRVLLVEADMRRRSLANFFQLRPPHGAYAVLSRQVSLADAVVETSIKNLYFLDVEPNIPNPADIIASNRYRTLVKAMEESFDYIIFDTPPTTTFVDSSILSTLVDGTIIVVRPRMTKRADVLRACDQLKKANANSLGACANFCENTGAEYYYAYYTPSGKRINDTEKPKVAPAPEEEEPWGGSKNFSVPTVKPVTLPDQKRR